MPVEAQIEFLVPRDELLFTYARETPPGAEAPNVQFERHAVNFSPTGSMAASCIPRASLVPCA